MPGKRDREVAHLARVEPGAAGRVRRRDGARHDVARRQLPARIGVEREAPAGPIHQQRAGAAHGLGDERCRVDAGELERGRMELEELEVAEPGARPVGQRPAVGGGHLRVGGDRVELAHAAGREHDRRRAGSAQLSPPRGSAITPATRPSSSEQAGHLGVLQQLDQRVLGGRRGSGSRSARPRSGRRPHG